MEASRETIQPSDPKAPSLAEPFYDFLVFFQDTTREAFNDPKVLKNMHKWTQQELVNQNQILLKFASQRKYRNTPSAEPFVKMLWKMFRYYISGTTTAKQTRGSGPTPEAKAVALDIKSLVARTSASFRRPAPTRCLSCGQCSKRSAAILLRLSRYALHAINEHTYISLIKIQ